MFYLGNEFSKEVSYEFRFVVWSTRTLVATLVKTEYSRSSTTRLSTQVLEVRLQTTASETATPVGKPFFESYGLWIAGALVALVLVSVVFFAMYRKGRTPTSPETAPSGQT